MAEKFENILFTQSEQSKTLIDFVEKNGNDALEALVKSTYDKGTHEVKEVKSIEKELVKIPNTKVLRLKDFILYYKDDDTYSFIGLIRVLPKRRRKK